MAPDSITVDETLRKAEVAKRILSDPVMVEAFERADARFVREWRDATNPVERDAAWYAQRALAEVKRALVEIESDGEVVRATGQQDEVELI